MSCPDTVQQNSALRSAGADSFSRSAQDDESAAVAAVGLIGPGRVGSELLRIWQQHPICAELRLHGLLNTQHALVSDTPLLTSSDQSTQNSKIDHLLTRLTHSKRQSVASFVRGLLAIRAGTHILIDATASAEVAACHTAWLRDGISVVTANKWALAASSDEHTRLQQPSGHQAGRYHHATTVMAGLPVLSTLRRLAQSGERITRISAVLSGSLSALIAGCQAGERFAVVLARLQQQGLTEPDPRLDLSGVDVARKLVIMARAAGLRLELAQVDVQRLLPAELLALPTLDMSLHGALLDRHWQLLSKKLSGKLVFRGDLEVLADGSCTAQCRLLGLNAGDPMNMLHGSDNQVQIFSNSYSQQPLLIQGAGAGIVVTARQLFADLMQSWQSA